MKNPTKIIKNPTKIKYKLHYPTDKPYKKINIPIKNHYTLSRPTHTYLHEEMYPMSSYKQTLQKN